MRKLSLADITLKNTPVTDPMSFKDKIDLAAMIDRLEIQRIELPCIQSPKADSLLIKSIASVVKNAELAVAVPLSGEALSLTVKALEQAGQARLQVCAPLSIAQMEYIYHKKSGAMLDMISRRLDECLATGMDVEFVAADATRAAADFLYEVLHMVLAKGIRYITLCDDGAKMLPHEMTAFLSAVRAAVPELSGVCLALHASDEICMADACAIAALECGINEIKVSSFPANCISLQNMVRLLTEKGEELDTSIEVRTAEIRRITKNIAQLCSRNLSVEPARDALQQEGFLTRFDGQDAVAAAARKLGYETTAEDDERIWKAFQGIISKKERISLRELDAIIAAESVQVPAVYHLTGYMISTGNGISSMAHMKLLYHDKELEGIAVGDGAVAAAFAAIEQATGRHFELDDFRIQSVTEGRESVGSTLVKLREHGKVYSGQGISTDIVGASIAAYISALNKIVFEEEQA